MLLRLKNKNKVFWEKLRGDKNTEKQRSRPMPGIARVAIGTNHIESAIFGDRGGASSEPIDWMAKENDTAANTPPWKP